MSRLATWVSNDVAGYVGVVNSTNNIEQANKYLENKKDMDSKASSDLSTWIAMGSDFVKNKDETAKELYVNEKDAIDQAVGSGTDIDPIAVCAAAIAKNTKDYAGIVREYREVQTAINCSNPAMVWTAMATDVELMKMYIEGKLEAYVNPPSDNDSTTGKNKTTTATAPKVTTFETPNIIDDHFDDSGISYPGDMGKVEMIVVHQTGDATANGYQGAAGAEVIHNVGRQNGHPTIAYHFVIDAEGKVHKGTPTDKLGRHVDHGNQGKIGISVCGNYCNGPMNDAQTKALTNMLAYLCNQYNLVPSKNTIVEHTYAGTYAYSQNGGQYGVQPNLTLDQVYSTYSLEQCIQFTERDCPGKYIREKLPDIIKQISNGAMTRTDSLWSAFAPLMKLGLEKKGTKGTDGLGFFPQICYMYVQLQAASAVSSYEGGEWGFPFSDDDMKSWDKKYVLLTSKFGTAERGRLHQGTDLVPGDDANTKNITFRAVKDGIVHLYSGWSNMNGITVYHPADKTWSRYLHGSKILVTEGQSVKKGDALGYVGGAGGYPVHLHLEFGKDATNEGNENITLTNGIAATDVWPQPEANVEGSYSGWRVS